MFIAQSAEDFLDRKALMQLSGLEFLQKMIAGELAAPPICEPVNYFLKSAEPGRVVFRGTPEFRHMNPIGALHGGWYGVLLDSAMACAVQSGLQAGQGYTTLEYKVNITRGIPLGTEVDCIGEVDHLGRSTGVAHGRIVGVTDGRLYATGSTTCIVLNA